MNKFNVKDVYAVSSDLISREIEETIVIVPLDSGIGKLDEDIYSLNETGKDVWDLIDGKRSFETIIQSLSKKYNTNTQSISNDIIELVSDFMDKGLIVEVKKNPMDQ